MSEDFKLYNGRPLALSLITENEAKVYDFLEENGIPFKTLKHSAAFTMEECEAVREEIGAPVFKNLFLTNKQQTLFFLLLMPAYKPFKTKYLSSQLSCARLSFATEEQMYEMLGVHPGAVTPMGLIFDQNLKVRVIIDEDLKRHDIYACHPCVNTASVAMSLQDLLSRFIPATGHNYTWVNLPAE